MGWVTCGLLVGFLWVTFWENASRGHFEGTVTLPGGSITVRFGFLDPAIQIWEAFVGPAQSICLCPQTHFIPVFI